MKYGKVILTPTLTWKENWIHFEILTELVIYHLFNYSTL